MESIACEFPKAIFPKVTVVLPLYELLPDNISVPPPFIFTPTPLMPPLPKLAKVAVCPLDGKLMAMGPSPLFTPLLLPI